MLVQNNYLLAKNIRTLTLQTYWIRTACLQAMSGVIQFCLRRTIYYERWVKKASSLIAHQNHYRGVEGPWAASGQTRQRWSRLPGDQTQFASRAAARLGAISWGRGRSLHTPRCSQRECRAANCFCLAWHGGGWLAWSTAGCMFLHRQNPTRNYPQRGKEMLRCNTFLYLWHCLLLRRNCLMSTLVRHLMRQSQPTAPSKENRLTKPAKMFPWS